MRLFFYIGLFLILFSKVSGQIHYIVTSTNDPVNPFMTVSGELRWAIEQANLSPGLDYIDFNISSSSFPVTINLQSNLPYFSEPVIIDGNTQVASSYTGAEPKITIDGTNGSAFTLDFEPGSSGSQIKNLTLIGTPYYILGFYNSHNNLIQNCVFLTGGQTIYFLASNNNNLKGNYFGTNHTLSSISAYPGNYNVISIHSSNNNTIGGLLPSDRNYFYNSPLVVAFVEIWWGSTYNKVSGNYFVNNLKNISLHSSTPVGNNNKSSPAILANISGGVTYIHGTSTANDFIEIYKSNTTGVDAVQLLGTTTANSLGQWNISTSSLIVGDKVVGTATDPLSNTSEFSNAAIVDTTPVCPGITFLTHTSLPNNSYCSKFEFNAGTSGYTGSCPTSVLVANWNYGDGSPTFTNCADGGGADCVHQFTTAGTYVVTLTITGPGTCTTSYNDTVKVSCNLPPCTDCISSFAPVPGKKYLVSAWVKEKNAPQSKTSYTFPSLTILFPSISSSTSPFLASGAIIDGWQRVEGEFTIPSTATNMSIKLDCNTGDCFFDDVRVLPFDGSMKSYVYDPATMRLVAELDERNYATLYEYDEEGKLIRVKKETEKGKMTIQENRNNTKK